MRALLIVIMLVLGSECLASGVAAQSPCSSVPEQAAVHIPQVVAHFTSPGLQEFRDALGIATLPDTTQAETLFHQPTLCQDILDATLTDLDDYPEYWSKIQTDGFHHFIGKIGPYYVLIGKYGEFRRGFPGPQDEPFDLEPRLMYVYELNGQALELLGRGSV